MDTRLLAELEDLPPEGTWEIAVRGMQPDALPGASVLCPVMLAAGAPALPAGRWVVGGALVG